jgi:hypothetical protein
VRAGCKSSSSSAWKMEARSSGCCGRSVLVRRSRGGGSEWPRSDMATTSHAGRARPRQRLPLGCRCALDVWVELEHVRA